MSSSTPEPELTYAEKLRTLNFGKVPGGTRESTKPPKHRKSFNASWEAGIAGEHRRDGSFMPYLDGNLKPIGVKQFAENRHHYEAKIKELRQPAEE